MKYLDNNRNILIKYLEVLNIKIDTFIIRNKLISFFVEYELNNDNNIIISERFEEDLNKKFLNSKKTNNFIKSFNNNLNDLYNLNIELDNNIYLLNKFNILNRCFMDDNIIIKKDKLIGLFIKNNNLILDGYLYLKFEDNKKYNLYLILENNNLKKNELNILHNYITKILKESSLINNCNYKGLLQYNINININNERVKNILLILYLLYQNYINNKKFTDTIHSKNSSNIKDNFNKMINILISKI